jgi:uncharacterized protein (TIGR00159 family)
MLDVLSLRAVDVVDFALVWVLVWAGIAWLRTSPARLALAGLAILGVVFLIGRQLGLVLTTWILQGFFAVTVLVVVVVFQQELRRLFEQIASLGPFRRRQAAPGMDTTDVVVRCVANLAQQHRGALIVLPGREPLDRHLDGGVTLDARLSEPLLLSLFDPHSPGHDGAILLENDLVTRFAVHLPLSTDHAQLGQRGTRHAAALGLSERTDALCLVVSEERGSVSVAHDGRLEVLASPQLAGARIRRFAEELSPQAEGRTKAWAGIAHHWREGLLAAPIAAALWMLAVPGASQVEITHEVAIKLTGLPEAYEIEAIEPPTARVRLSGRRRDLLLLDLGAVEARVDAILAELGRRTFRLSAQNVVVPDRLKVVGIEPGTIRVSLRRASTPPQPPPDPAQGDS